MAGDDCVSSFRTTGTFLGYTEGPARTPNVYAETGRHLPCYAKYVGDQEEAKHNTGRPVPWLAGSTEPRRPRKHHTFEMKCSARWLYRLLETDEVDLCVTLQSCTRSLFYRKNIDQSPARGMVMRGLFRRGRCFCSRVSFIGFVCPLRLSRPSYGYHSLFAVPRVILSSAQIIVILFALTYVPLEVR